MKKKRYKPCSFIKPDKTGRRKPAIKAYQAKVGIDRDISFLNKMPTSISGY